MTHKPHPYKIWLKRWERAGSPCAPTHNHVVVVSWVDATGSMDDSDIEPTQAYSVGFLLYADKEFIRVGMEAFADADNRTVSAIPAGMIQAVVNVCRLPSFDSRGPSLQSLKAIVQR